MEGQGQQPPQQPQQQQQQQLPQQPPGWYPNPQGPGKRYWDGTQWTGSYKSDKEDHTTRTVLIVAGAIVGVLLLFVGGCVACVAITADTADEAVKEIDKEIKREQKRNAITTSQYRSLELGGVTRSEVLRRYGAPDSSSDFESRDIPGSDCIYYKQADGEFLDFFQLCFNKRNGELESKQKF